MSVPFGRPSCLDDFYSHVYMLCASQGVGVINGDRGGRSSLRFASQGLSSKEPVAQSLARQRLPRTVSCANVPSRHKLKCVALS